MTQESEKEFCVTRRMLKKELKGKYIYIYIWGMAFDGRVRGPENVYSWMEDGGTHLRMMLEIFNLNCDLFFID